MIGDGWLFGPTHKKITPVEYKKVHAALHSHGFNEFDLEKVDLAFHGPLFANENSTQIKGITKKEVASIIDWMRSSHDEHMLSPHKVDLLEAELLKHL